MNLKYKIISIDIVNNHLKSYLGGFLKIYVHILDMPAKPELFSGKFRKQRGQQTIRSVLPSLFRKERPKVISELR